MASNTKNPRAIFQNLKEQIAASSGFLMQFSMKLQDRIDAFFMRNTIPSDQQKFFRSMNIVVGPFENLFPKNQKMYRNFRAVELPPPPFQAPEKIVARVELSGMPPRAKKVIAALDAMISAGM